MECPSCGGLGCEFCRKKGTVEITQCPLKIVTSDIWLAIELAELYEKGLPPVAGGSLEQSKMFVESARFVWQEQKYWKNKMQIQED
jgi:NADPH-dependent 7-cyano-7-deazaguanine reductase QueF-like protein